MVFSEADVGKNIITSAAKKRRLRRKKLVASRASIKITNSSEELKPSSEKSVDVNEITKLLELNTINKNNSKKTKVDNTIKVQKVVEMSSNEATISRDDVKAAREAKKLAKQKGKNKGSNPNEVKESAQKDTKKDVPSPVKKVDKEVNENKEIKASPKAEVSPVKSKDEVDRAVITNEQTLGVDKSKDDVKAERAAKKAAKQAKKKKDGDSGDAIVDMTVKDVVETLKDIVNVAKEVQDVTAKVKAISMEPKKASETVKKEPQGEHDSKASPQEDSGKSKAELRAERRAKQEAQRAAKQATQVQQKAAPVPEKPKAKDEDVKTKEERPSKSKSVEKSKPKPKATRVNWFQHLHMQQDNEALKKLPVNSPNLHPAIVKLGVQMASRTVFGSNARCIALLEAIKKMVKDYTLPAKTEFSRGLEAHLASSLDFLWSMRQPSASQTNAVKFFRHHLTQLPNNVGEYDAKKTLQEEIDRYIREQIDMAGEAISLAVRKKISNGDNILTYGCSSLVERILREAWAAGVQFRVVVVGARAGAAAATDMLRRLALRGLPTTYVDITAVSYLMDTVDKVVLGASSLLVNGWVLGAAGTAAVALAARARNVPVLVACETHKFSERVQTDAFVYNEIGDPDELVDKTDENSPLKDWRSNPNLTPLNLTYDVTPPSLVTAVVTELAILPCTSAPVVLRFKLSEYGIQG